MNHVEMSPIGVCWLKVDAVYAKSGHRIMHVLCLEKLLRSYVLCDVIIIRFANNNFIFLVGNEGSIEPNYATSLSLSLSKLLW